jgi:5-formyltetrahydrofolate cyclo-ligase
MDKKSLRNEMLVVLNKMDRIEHEKFSQLITNRILTSNEFIKADSIGITISRYPEVNTLPLIEAAWKAGKQVAIPKCIHATREMDFRAITSFNSLETVYINLLEPIVKETDSIVKENIDLQIVPGVIFTEEGYRIGFGGGYYDRYMTDFPGDALSLAFECQIKQMVPVESHDIPVSKIFTDKRVIIC